MSRLYAGVTLRGLYLIGALCIGLHVPAQKPETLQRAWQEYQFLSLDVAEKLFLETQDSDVDPEYLLEAKVGLAMIAQYRERNPDLEKAEALYQEALAGNPKPEVRALINSFLADLYLSRGADSEARVVLDTLIDENIDSVVGQDALIRRLTLMMGEYASPQSIAAARNVEADLNRIRVKVSEERPYLIPLIYSLLGRIYFWAEDYASTVQQYENFTTLGNANTTSYGTQASALYRIANIYEQKLNQPEQAGLFYRRLVEDYPNSAMSYYALEKAILLGAFSREEANKIRLGGLTPEILDELFSAVPAEGKVSE
jgi:tetratricopeptide (TPR) repeat protein